MKGSDPTVPVAALGGLEIAVNAALALDPETLRRLAKLEGRVIAILPDAPKVKLYLAPHGEGLRFMSFYEGEVDTTLAGPARSFFALARSNRGFSSGELTIKGDVELGREFQRIFAAVDLDLEEHLSRISGDVIAHQAGNLVRGFAGWLSHAAQTFRSSAGDYLQQEARVVPAPVEVEDFAHAAESLRMDVDRLEAHIKQLRRKLEE